MLTGQASPIREQAGARRRTMPNLAPEVRAGPHDQRGVGNRRQLKSLELQQKLHWHADRTRSQQQPEVPGSKGPPVPKQNRRKRNCCNQKAKGDVFGDVHFAERDFPKQKAGSPERPGDSENYKS
jgi:hypothetical protein